MRMCFLSRLGADSVSSQGTLFNLFLTGINWSQMVEYLRVYV